MAYFVIDIIIDTFPKTCVFKSNELNNKKIKSHHLERVYLFVFNYISIP